MILFVGNKEKGFFAEDIARQQNMTFQCISSNLHLANQAEYVLQYKDEVTAIIYDLEQYADEKEEIVKWILRIEEAVGVKTIIYAAGFLPGSQVIQLLYQNGIKNFIFSIYQGEQKEDLELCLNGYYESFGYEEKRGISFSVEKEDDESEEKEKNKTICIGVAGAIARMGTTTQALQLVKFLQYSGYKAAYMEMNSHHYVEDLKEAYEEVEHNEDVGCVRYMNVDMYYRTNRLQEVLKKDYDYLIFDYGVYSDKTFNKISFLEKELQIFVVGSKPGGEFESTYEVLKNNFYMNAYYIFNFVAKSEQKDVLELMEDRADVTYFSEDAKDPFSFSGQGDLWKKMLGIEPKVDMVKKKGIRFGRRRRK